MDERNHVCLTLYFWKKAWRQKISWCQLDKSTPVSDEKYSSIEVKSVKFQKSSKNLFIKPLKLLNKKLPNSKPFIDRGLFIDRVFIDGGFTVKHLEKSYALSFLKEIFTFSCIFWMFFFQILYFVNVLDRITFWITHHSFYGPLECLNWCHQEMTTNKVFPDLALIQKKEYGISWK